MVVEGVLEWGERRVIRCNKKPCLVVYLSIYKRQGNWKCCYNMGKCQYDDTVKG